MFKLTAIDDNDVTVGLAVVAGVVLDGSNNIPTGDDLTEDDMLAVKMGSVVESQEELRAVSVRSRVGHGEVTAACVLVVEVLILELFSVSIDALATGAVTSGEVTTLGHEAINDTVELAALVAEVMTTTSFSLLASAESSEVFGSLRSVTIQLHNNSAGFLAANLDVEIDIVELLMSSRCCLFRVHSWSWGAVASVMAKAATATDATKVKAGLGVGSAEAAAKVKA